MSTDWIVEVERDKLVTMSEDELRKKLRKRDLKGVELARREDVPRWAPLHIQAIFHEEVPFTGDSLEAARGRVWRDFLGHLSVFVAVIVGFTIAVGGVPSWAGFWGIGLAIHAAHTAMSLNRKESAPPMVEKRAIPEPELREVSLRPTDFMVQVDRALAPLDAAGEACGPMREVARDLDALHERLKGLSSDRRERELEEQREAAAGHRDQARSEADREVFDAEIAAIDQSMLALADAHDARHRVASKKRTLLLQLQTMNTAAAQRETLGDSGDLVERASLMREELKAEVEVEESLARARRAQTQGG